MRNSSFRNNHSLSFGTDIIKDLLIGVNRILPFKHERCKFEVALTFNHGSLLNNNFDECIIREDCSFPDNVHCTCLCYAAALLETHQKKSSLLNWVSKLVLFTQIVSNIVGRVIGRDFVFLNNIFRYQICAW